MTSNYEFLEMLHRELKPRGYLEIGVRHGDSLKLAQCRSIGIDPKPAMHPGEFGQFRVYDTTSDDFFDKYADEILHEFPVDLVYIDGMHLFEYALRDFINVAQWANERTVVVFDDTHPYSQSIATRIQPPGDWTGDVWKTMDLIHTAGHVELSMAQVDVSPTGAFAAWGFGREYSQAHQIKRELELFLDAPEMVDDIPVPADILDRRHTITPEEAIKRILEDLA